jgi:hypothetical protein
MIPQLLMDLLFHHAKDLMMTMMNDKNAPNPMALWSKFFNNRSKKKNTKTQNDHSFTYVSI